MPSVPHPGVSEQGWLADLKETAEQVGSQIYGERIRWDVEGLLPGTGRRPDIVVRRDSDSSVLATGEAKRPDTPAGAHPLIATEIRDAIEKARMSGAPLCFTTNFFDVAIFDATDNQRYSVDLDRLQGNLIPLIPPATSSSTDWWNAIPSAERVQLTLVGLRQLFERLALSARQSIARDVDETTLHVFTRVTDRLLNPLFEAFVMQRDTTGLTGEFFGHALQVHLNPNDDGDARFLVAQGIAEILTATLFYRNISDHFSLQRLLAGTSPRTAALLVKRVRQSFDQAIRSSGDYETIFSLSPAAHWVLSHGGSDVLQQWKDLFDFVEQLDFSAVSSDVIGSIFERLISPERRHAMGQHYTDSRIAASMSHWAVRRPEDTVADVACGAGTFLVETWKCLHALGQPHARILKQVYGNDLDPFAVHLAMVNMATREIYRGANYPAIRLGDAFDLRHGEPILHITPAASDTLDIAWPESGFDAVVGNPPYSRRAEDVAGLSRSLLQLRAPAPQGMGGNVAAWFGLLASAFLKEGGRWGLVLPTSVLQNANLAPWRQWLRRNFDVVVWHTEDDVWFSDARVATVVVLAEKSKSDEHSLHFVDIRERVDGELVEIDSIPSPTTRAVVRDLTALPPTADVFVAGTVPGALTRFGASGNVRTVAELDGVAVYSGNKLGHAMYQLRDVAPNRPGVLRDLEGNGMQVRLNKNLLLPFLRSPVDERTGEFTTSDYWVLNAPKQLPSSGALTSYINHCRKLGAHRSPTIALRGAHWWSVDWRTSQVAVQIHPGFLHQVWWSEAPFVAKNNFHVLGFADSVAKGDRELIAASLSSGFGALGALYVSSEVGNEGVRWLSTEQFGLWPVLDPASVSRSDRDAVLLSYRRFRQLRAQEIHLMDDATMSAWRELTACVARSAGLRDPAGTATDVIETARQACVRRSNREALALSGRVRTGVRRSTFARHVHTRLESSPAVGPILDGLTGGSRVIRLRPAAELLQGTFGLFANAVDVLQEESLSVVLGPGFECAPVVSTDDYDVAAEVAALLNGLTHDLVGQEPIGTQATATYNEIAGTVRRAAADWLQREVRNRLN